MIFSCAGERMRQLRTASFRVGLPLPARECPTCEGMVWLINSGEPSTVCSHNIGKLAGGHEMLKLQRGSMETQNQFRWCKPLSFILPFCLHPLIVNRGWQKTMRPTRLGDAYHIERALAARQGIARYPCGCERCHGFKSQSVQTVERHHRKYGRDSKLNEPFLVSSTTLLD
jgi:hypothetical protein